MGLVILSRMEWFPFPIAKFLVLLLCILAGLIGLYILCEIGYCIHWYYWFYCIKKKKEATQPESISDPQIQNETQTDMDQGENNPTFVEESNIYDPEPPCYSEISKEAIQLEN